MKSSSVKEGSFDYFKIERKDGNRYVVLTRGDARYSATTRPLAVTRRRAAIFLPGIRLVEFLISHSR
jgi:hypothetical protein